MTHEFNNFSEIEDLIKKHFQNIIEVSPNLEKLLLYLSNEEISPILKSEIISFFHNDKNKDVNLFTYILQTKYENYIKYITIFVKQICGKTIKLLINKNTNINELYPLTYEKRDEQQKLVTYDNYLRSIKLTTRCTKIFNSTIITEILKPWTCSFGIDFNINTLSGICPISLEEIEIPFMLNPGCSHCFDSKCISKYIETGNKNCPICKMKIKI